MKKIIIAIVASALIVSGVTAMDYGSMKKTDSVYKERLEDFRPSAEDYYVKHNKQIAETTRKKYPKASAAECAVIEKRAFKNGLMRMYDATYVEDEMTASEKSQEMGVGKKVVDQLVSDLM